MSEIATPRWRLKKSIPSSGWWFWRKPWRHVFELVPGGETFTVYGDEGAIDQVMALPWDYIDLGNATADDKLERVVDDRQMKARLDDALDAVRILQGRIDALPEADRIIPILSADLEKALNFMMRFAQSLGVQAQGPLYDEMQTLLSKYKMVYRAPTRGQIMREAMQDPGWSRTETLQAAFDPDTGKMDLIESTIEGELAIRELEPGEVRQAVIPATDDDPFDYVMIVSRDPETKSD